MEKILQKRKVPTIKIVKYDKYKTKTYGENTVEKKVLTTKIVKITPVRNELKSRRILVSDGALGTLGVQDQLKQNAASSCEVLLELYKTAPVLFRIIHPCKHNTWIIVEICICTTYTCAYAHTCICIISLLEHETFCKNE